MQALVRGHNVRKQAKMTLQCMQALVRVQARVLDQRMKQSDQCTSRKSTFSDTNSAWGSRYHQDMSDRRSMVCASFTLYIYLTMQMCFCWCVLMNTLTHMYICMYVCT